jgi:hypothetical protein
MLALLLLGGCTEEQVVDAIVTTYYGYHGQFHAAGCSVIQSVDNSALSKFTSRDAAIAAGLVRCPVCRP